MRFVGGLIFHVFSNALAILVANHFVPSFQFEGNFIQLLIASVIFTVINALLRPVIKLFLGPFIVLTFGLFILVVNALMLYILDIFTEPLTIQGLKALFLSTLLIAVVNAFVGFGAKLFYRRN